MEKDLLSSAPAFVPFWAFRAGEVAQILLSWTALLWSTVKQRQRQDKEQLWFKMIWEIVIEERKVLRGKEIYVQNIVSSIKLLQKGKIYLCSKIAYYVFKQVFKFV